MTPLVSPSVFLDVELPDAASTAWVGHIPFALWIVEQTKPRIFVELGTHYGHSYFSFCKSVLENDLPTKCYAVDTWEGDEHAGRGDIYGKDVYAYVDSVNRRLYGAFSHLQRMRFDDAAGYFADGTIDLLHIDGLHSYDAVRHDFETWLPKLSSRGVVLFHDTNVRERGFGVWRLWEELSQAYPHVEFAHSYGLGVLFVGKEQPAVVSELLADWANPSTQSLIRQFFFRLGKNFILSSQLVEHDTLHAPEAELRQALDKSLATVAELRQTLDQVYSSRSWRFTAPLRSIRRRLLKN